MDMAVKPIKEISLICVDHITSSDEYTFTVSHPGFTLISCVVHGQTTDYVPFKHIAQAVDKNQPEIIKMYEDIVKPSLRCVVATALENLAKVKCTEFYIPNTERVKYRIRIIDGLFKIQRLIKSTWIQDPLNHPFTIKWDEIELDQDNVDLLDSRQALQDMEDIDTFLSTYVDFLPIPPK